MELTGSNVIGIKVIGFNVVGLDVTGATVVGLKDTGAIVVGLNVTGATVVGLKVTGAVVVGLEVIIIGFFVVGDEVRGTFLLVGAQVVTTAGIIVVGIGRRCRVCDLEVIRLSIDVFREFFTKILQKLRYVHVAISKRALMVRNLPINNE